MNVAWDLWEHRNGIKHDPCHPWRIAELNTMADEIRMQFRLGTATLLAQDQHRLNCTMEDIVNYSPLTQQQWIRSLHAARTRYVASQNSMEEEVSPNPVVANMRSGLHDWLHGTHNGDP